MSGKFSGFFFDWGSFWSSIRKSRSYLFFPSGFSGLHWSGIQTGTSSCVSHILQMLNHTPTASATRNSSSVSTWNIWNTYPHHWHSHLQIHLLNLRIKLHLTIQHYHTLSVTVIINKMENAALFKNCCHKKNFYSDFKSAYQHGTDR